MNEAEINKKTLMAVAEKMMLSARTAPKARGIDNLFIKISEGEEISLLSSKMTELGKKYNSAFMIRDAGNIENIAIVLLIGSKIQSIGLEDICGYCGYDNCKQREMHPEHPCAYNTNDLGIAIGSAVSIAIDNRVDNRVMFSIGKAAIELGLLPKEVKICFGIPLSATSKNPFFDRK